MKATEEKADIFVSAETEKIIRQRLSTLDEDRKSAVDAREALTKIRRKLQPARPH